MDEPKNPESQGDIDPFAELPNDPSFEGIVEGIVEESAAPASDAESDVLDSTEFNPSTDSSRDLGPGSIDSVPPPAARRVLSKMAGLFAAVLVLVLGVIGWVAWQHWCDREHLEKIEADLLSARDGAEQSKGRTEESGERDSARALATRVDEILDAPWWDRIALRIIDQERIASAKSQTDELLLNASHRAANRAWWIERTSAVDAAVAGDDRTIPSVQTASDDLLSAQPPHPGEGGFSDEGVASLNERLEKDLDQLMRAQNEQLDLRQSQLALIRTSATLDELASALAALDAVAPPDRNPPEIDDALAAIRAQGVIVGDFLSARDAMESELKVTLSEIAALDLNTGSAETMQLVATRLGALETPDDARFDAVRDLAARGAAAATQVRALLQTRDSALAWFESQRNTLESLASVEELAAFTQGLTNDAPPPSDLQIVTETAEDFLARLSARTIVLAEERRLMDESRARAEVFAAALLAVNSALESGAIAQAAQTLVDAAPETQEQVAACQLVKEGFALAAIARIKAMADDARTTGGWRDVATSLRDCLASESVTALAADFTTETAALWQSASIEEDKLIYEDLQRLATGPYEEFAPVARWYLTPSRLRGVMAPMHAQIAKSLEVLDLPGLTLQIEGVEWSDAQCDWSTPRTSLTVAINEVPFGFDLSQVSASETTLLGTEVPLQARRDERVEFGVSGYFDCADDDGVFAGSGGLTMDELRSGGRFALPFWNDGDQSLTPHKLLLISIPDDEVRVAMSLANWIDPRAPIEVPESEPVAAPAPEVPTVDPPVSDPQPTV